MIRLLATITLQLLASVVGLLITSLVVDGFSITPTGLVICAAIFTLFNFLFEPLITKLSLQYLPVFRGGIALVTTFIGLWVTDALSSELTIQGIYTLLIATLVIWLAIILASVLLPLVLFKKILQNTTQPNPN